MSNETGKHKVEYTVISSKNLTDLVNTVNSFIGLKWMPQGGIAIKESSMLNSTEYCQSMIRFIQAPIEQDDE